MGSSSASCDFGVLEPGYRSGNHSLELNGLEPDIVGRLGFVCNLCAAGLDM